MNRTDLEQAITLTLDKITQVKQQIEETTDPEEKQKLIREKKELQYLQLWNIDQIEALRREE